MWGNMQGMWQRNAETCHQNIKNNLNLFKHKWVNSCIHYSIFWQRSNKKFELNDLFLKILENSEL